MPQSDGPSRACKCLNVRIWTQPHTDKPPDFLMAAPGDPEYSLAFVGEQGVSIVHPQVTMRTRKMGPSIADSSRCIRFTTLTCLLCQTLAYRVLQSVASDVDRQEGPLLPSPDWVEQETLLSSCGWIEVHNDCLLAEDVTQLSSSSTYLPAFGVALSQTSSPSVTHTQPDPDSSQESSHSQAVPPTGPFLHNLKPLFPPAPFVPSHPVFAYLSSIAVEASDHLRSSIEEQIASIVRDRFTELQKADDALRHNVAELWRRFVENMCEVEKQLGPRAGETRRRDASRGVSLSLAGTPGTPLVSVRDFIPIPSTAPRVLSPSSSHHKISTLSTSLATSGFLHQVRMPDSTQARERSSSGSPRSPPPYSSHPSSLDSAESSMPSSSLHSSPVLSPHVNGDSIAQPFKRSMDESRDTAVSFRYFRILEDDLARARQLPVTSQTDATKEGVTKTTEPARENKGGSNTAKAATPAKETEEAPAHPTGNPDRDVRSPTDGTPRKRVQFDIRADAVTGERTETVINGGFGKEEELIFDLDDGASVPESSDAAPVLPFIENAQVSRHRSRHRVANLGALPASLSSLRPTSLPAYSALQSSAHQEPTASVASRTAATVLVSRAVQSEYPDQPDPQEEEILRLVAANTPSHRNAWKRNSKAWQLFVSRRRNGVPGALIPEETEDGSTRAGDDADDDDWVNSRNVRWSHGNATFPASLPIEISPLSRQREPLSLASYQPKTSLADRAGMIVPALPDGKRHSMSTSTLRRASYAERDRSRAIDPGTLDFVAGEVEDADESEEEHSRVDEERGRKRAFKILQARSKIPEAGMWMSLA